MKFKKGFEKRLSSLYNALLTYKTTGNLNNVIPCLFSCMLYCWCQSPFEKTDKTLEDVDVKFLVNLKKIIPLDF